MRYVGWTIAADAREPYPHQRRTGRSRSQEVMERLGFRRFVFFACGLPDLPRRVGIQGGDAQPDD